MDKDSRPGFSLPNATAILNAGLAAAAIDAFYFSTAALFRGHSPLIVFRRIAGFWLGGRSNDPGISGIFVGVATHMGLATIMAAGFVLAMQRFRLPRDRALPFGAAYGLFLYVLMYFVVMPLRWPARFPSWMGWQSIGDILIHVTIGIAIALILRSRSRAETACAPLAG
jgi:hypothetical protein